MGMLLEEIVTEVNENLIPEGNQLWRPYQKGVRTQDKPINTCFEHTVEQCVRTVVAKLGHTVRPAYTDSRSDISLKIDGVAILQIDAKGCIETDNDFEEYAPTQRNALPIRGLKIHLGENQHTRTFTEQLDRNRSKLVPIQPPVVGKQLRQIQGLPVFTMVCFLKWNYSPDQKYYATSCGVANFPHEGDVYGIAAKQPGSELRFLITNSSLYQIHSFVSASPRRTAGSTPSEHSEVQVPLLQSLLSQNQQTGPTQDLQEGMQPTESASATPLDTSQSVPDPSHVSAE